MQEVVWYVVRPERVVHGVSLTTLGHETKIYVRYQDDSSLYE